MHKHARACWLSSHLLPCEASDPELPYIPVYIAGAASLNVLQLLQVVEGARQAKGGAVKVSTPDVKREQELAGKHKLAAPAGHGVATNG